MNREGAAPDQYEGIPHQPEPTWDVGALSRALNREPELTKDRVHGPGLLFRLGQDRALEVVLFPPHAERRSGIVRLGTADSLQEFYRQAAPAVRPEGLIFQVHGVHDLLISLAPSGELMVYRAVTEESPEESPDGSAPPHGAGGDDPDEPGSGEALAEGARTISPPPAAEPGRQERAYDQKLSGRVGRAPRFHRTRKGALVGEFSLAVRDTEDPDEQPVWHRIAVFDNNEKRRFPATKLQDDHIHQGEFVDCLGCYRHETEYTNPRTGKPVRKVELRVTAVKRRTPAATHPAPER